MKAFNFIAHLVTIIVAIASIAHDIGKGLRFAWIYTTKGAAAAVADHFVNGIKCGC